MKKITINVTFNKWGHGNINVVPSNYKQWDPVQSSSQDYNLDSGEYTILFDTVTGGGGSIVVTHNENIIAQGNLDTGLYSGHLRITI